MAVVRSKLRPPPLRPGTLPRRALEAALDEAAAEVVILVGPAGQGKTTALALRAAHERASGRATGWLTLDESDNDRRQLHEQLGALVAGLGGGAPSVRGDDLGAWLAEQLERAAGPLSLYFDDFHLLEAPELLAGFRRFLLALPDGVRVYVAARALPELGLSRLALQRTLRVLDAGDLCFSRSEVAELCEGADLSAPELSALHERTGGWPAALQLFRMALKSPRVRASLADPRGPQLRELSAYLSENVLALQSPELGELLLQTAPLEVLSVELARRVTGRADAHELLARLERAGFFVRAADAEAGSFRYHPVLAQLLAEQLAARSPAALARIHALAAQHYSAASA
jgi:LuxR family transcriptional regulator, maltose regulon positive regulatory protein